MYTETSRALFTGNGGTTVFAAGFYFRLASELVVTLTPSGGTPVIQTEGVHYSVTPCSGIGVADGAVVMVGAPPVASGLKVERTVPFTQATSLRQAGSFDPAAHEDQYDELTFQTQQLHRRLTAVEGAGAPGSVVAGNGLSFVGTTLNVGPGAGIQANADTIEVLYGAAADLADVTKAAESAGVGLAAARIDHKHDVSTAVAGAIAVGDVAAEGGATSLARSDHRHSLAAPAAPADVTKAAAAAGGSTAPARSDHKHDVSTAAAVALTDAANAEGVAASLSRSDHTHAHGDRGGGTLHAPVVSGGAAGFMAAADKAKLDGLLAEVVSQGNVKTTDATPTQVLEWTPADATVENVDLRLAAIKNPANEAAGYHVRLTVRRYDGVTSILAQVRIAADQESNAAWDVVVSASSPKILVTVTGVAATSIWWLAQARRMALPVNGP